MKCSNCDRPVDPRRTDEYCCDPCGQHWIVQSHSSRCDGA